MNIPGILHFVAFLLYVVQLYTYLHNLATVFGTMFLRYFGKSQQSRQQFSTYCLQPTLGLLSTWIPDQYTLAIPHYGSLKSYFKVMSLDTMEGF